MVSHKRAREIPLYIRMSCVRLWLDPWHASGENIIAQYSLLRTTYQWNVTFSPLSMVYRIPTTVLPTFLRTLLSNRFGTPCRSLLFLGQHLLHKTFLTLCRRRRRRRPTSSHNIRGSELPRKNCNSVEAKLIDEKRPLKLVWSRRLVQYRSSTRAAMTTLVKPYRSHPVVRLTNK